MVFEEALRELGIDAAATPEEARRAYLRGIKTRKPETDPEGFRRLREAYELLSAALAEPREDEEKLAAGFEEETAVPELQALVARLRRLPAETSTEERVALLRGGIGEFPASAGLRWWLIQELEGAGRYGEALEALQQAGAVGLPGFLEARALQYPDSLAAAEAARLEASGHPAILAVIAQAYLRTGRPKEAGRVLRRAIDRMAEVDPHTLRPFPIWLPRGLLGLEAAGLRPDAQYLHNRFWSWLSGTGDAALIEQWGMSFQWLMAHELALLGSSFPPELRRAAARAALDEERESAVYAARGLVENDPGRATRASEMLSGLPILQDLFGEILDGARAAPQAAPIKQVSGKAGAGWTGVFALLLVLGLIRALASLFVGHPDNVAPSPPPATPRQIAHRDVDTAWAILSKSCDGRFRPLPANVCTQARAATQAVREGDCAGARRALEAIAPQLQSASPMAASTLYRFEFKLRQAMTLACGAAEPGPAP